MSINCWQDLEREVDKLLINRVRKHPFYYHRFYDTKSASNFLPKQPADFFCINRGRVHFIECKFSEKHESLKSCFAGAVKDHQLASAFLVKRAMASYWILFYSSKTQRFELWDGGYCREQGKVGKPLNLAERQVFDSLENAVLGGMMNGYRKDLLRSASRSES